MNPNNPNFRTIDQHIEIVKTRIKHFESQPVINNSWSYFLDNLKDTLELLETERARRLDAEEALSVYADKSRYAYETANGWNYMWNDQGHIARAHFEKYKDEK